MNKYVFNINHKVILMVSLVFMSFFTAPIFSYSPIRFSDVGAVLIIYFGYRASSVTTFSALFKFWCFFVVIAIINTIIHFVLTLGFDLLNAFVSLFRLVVGVLSAILVVNFSKKVSCSAIASVISCFVLFHCFVILLYAFIFYVLGWDSIFKIVTPGEERNSLITENYLFFNHFRVIVSTGFYYRLAGVFEEPAWFGWVVTLFCSFILQYQIIYKEKVVFRWFWLIVGASYFFTVSISAIFGLLFLLFVYLFLKHGMLSKMWIMFLFLSLFSLVYATLPDAVMNRVMLIMSGGDGSTSARVIGSINGAINAISVNPFIGSGLGDNNRLLLYRSIENSGQAIGFYTSDGSFIMDMHNIFLSVLSSLGVPGGIVFMLAVLTLVYYRLWVLLAGYVVVFMSVNVFDSYLFLVSWGLAYLIFMRRKPSVYA